MSIRSFLQLRRLAIENRMIVRQKKIKNLSEIKTVFALVSIQSMDEYEKWELLFSNISKNRYRLEWLVYLSNADKNAEFPENVFTKKDINFLGFPKQGDYLKGKFSNIYDLTLDLNFDNVYLLNWIWVHLNAHLRVGSDFKKDMLPYYDFTMSTKDPVKQPKLFIDQVFYFLDNINK